MSNAGKVIRKKKRMTRWMDSVIVATSALLEDLRDYVKNRLS